MHPLPPPSDALDSLRASLADRYRIEQPLGVGGMATVYLAKDLRHERDVAIKVLHPNLADVVGRERFTREIRLAASLSHPHILPLYDSGDAARGRARDEDARDRGGLTSRDRRRGPVGASRPVGS